MSTGRETLPGRPGGPTIPDGRRPAAEGRRLPGDDRGAILIVALLLLLALTGIGLVAAQGVSVELNLGGAARVAQVARNVATGGAEGTMAFAGVNPSGFNQFVLADANHRVSMNQISAGFYDDATDGTGSFGREPVTADTAYWRSTMQTILTTHRAPGFEVGEYCFRRYIAVTDGYYGTEVTTVGGGNAGQVVDRSAQARSLTALYVGPVDCP